MTRKIVTVSKTFFLGITGGISCGKSLVYNYFCRLGAKGISADMICRDITMPGETALKEIEELFGEDVIKKNGELNRQYLGKIIFSDDDKRKKINMIIHPKVERNILDWARKIRSADQAEKLAVLEIPLLFETGSFSWLDGVLTVSASKKNSLDRMMIRDKLSLEECQMRYNSQLSLSEKEKCSNWVIQNNGTKEEAEKLTKKIFLEITSRRAYHSRAVV